MLVAAIGGDVESERIAVRFNFLLQRYVGLGDVTKMLGHWRTGDDDARNDLFETIYADLHKRAGGMLNIMGARKPLQPTELVNEAFLKLADGVEIDWHDRNHFFAVASKVMRQVLVDIHRQAQAQKRSQEKVTLVTEHLGDAELAFELTDLELALVELGAIDPQLAKVVELKFFSGMTTAEVADCIEQSESTVKRNWRSAKAWLLDRLTNTELPASPAP